MIALPDFLIAGWAAEGFFVGEDPFVGDGAVFGIPGARALLAAEFFEGLGLGDDLPVADGFELFAKFAPGMESVHFAGAVELAFHAEAGGEVLEKDAAGSLVDLLATGAGTADEFLEELVIGDAKRGESRVDGVGAERTLHERKGNEGEGRDEGERVNGA